MQKGNTELNLKTFSMNLNGTEWKDLNVFTEFEIFENEEKCSGNEFVYGFYYSSCSKGYKSLRYCFSKNVVREQSNPIIKFMTFPNINLDNCDQGYIMSRSIMTDEQYINPNFNLISQLNPNDKEDHDRNKLILDTVNGMSLNVKSSICLQLKKLQTIIAGCHPELVPKAREFENFQTKGVFR